MALGVRRIDSEDLYVALPSLLPLIAKLAQLLAANHGIVTRIENQYDVLAAQLGQLDGFSILAGQ
jgi:hypothetical protein